MITRQMITRQEAVSVIYAIINSGIISEDLEDALQDIANCIEDEETLQIHSWGMPEDDYMTLHMTMRTDLPEYEEFMKKCEEIHQRYVFNDETTGD